MYMPSSENDLKTAPHSNRDNVLLENTQEGLQTAGDLEGQHTESREGILHNIVSYGCFQKYGKTPKSSICFIGFSIIFTIHFGG